MIIRSEYTTAGWSRSLTVSFDYEKKAATYTVRRHTPAGYTVMETESFAEALDAYEVALVLAVAG